MRISIVGTGYVGLVTAACLADLGHRVVAMDVDASKIAMLKEGRSPIHEKGLSKLLKKNIEQDRLIFSTSLSAALKDCEVIFIAVGTPSDNVGAADLQYVFDVAMAIGSELDHPIMIVDKSTVPPGTGRKVRELIAARTTQSFDVASCPEFLREGSGIEDFFHPDRIVIGVNREETGQTLLEIFDRIQAEKIVTSLESAEMIKYASNAFLATKISFINEIANLCECVGADVQEVAYGMGKDSRIGPKFLNAGLGYGGSCFPKDVRALNQIANGHQYHFKLLRSVIEVNREQRRVVVKKLKEKLGTLKQKQIAVLGLTFKANTDDVRESASLEIIETLRQEGAVVRAYDPVGSQNARKEMPDLTICDSVGTTLDGSDAVFIATEWEEFQNVNWSDLASRMRRPLVVDGRNLLDLRQMAELGIEVVGIGRGHRARNQQKHKITTAS